MQLRVLPCDLYYVDLILRVRLRSILIQDNFDGERWVQFIDGR